MQSQQTATGAPAAAQQQLPDIRKHSRPPHLQLAGAHVQQARHAQVRNLQHLLHRSKCAQRQTRLGIGTCKRSGPCNAGQEPVCGRPAGQQTCLSSNAFCGPHLIADQDVGWLDVAVDDAGGVQVLQAERDLQQGTRRCGISKSRPRSSRPAAHADATQPSGTQLVWMCRLLLRAGSLSHRCRLPAAGSPTLCPRGCACPPAGAACRHNRRQAGRAECSQQRQVQGPATALAALAGKSR